jgi:hypothetical protein
MRWSWLFLAFALVTSPAATEEDSLCQTLNNLWVEAHSSGNPQRVAILKEEAMTFACVKNKEVEAQAAFCTAAFGAVGREFTHAFPWVIYECLRASHIKPDVETVEQYTGIRARKKVRHLRAR